MGHRLDLQALLSAIPEVEKAYFQPPQDATMRYPCIVYQRDDSDVSYADNVKYGWRKRYQVTVIDRRPDSPITDAVEALEYVRFDRFFITDGLNHTVFQMYF